MTLTNHNGAFKKCAISSKSVAISMLFIFPGALGVFQEYTILYYGEFVQYLSNHGINIVMYAVFFQRKLPILCFDITEADRL